MARWQVPRPSRLLSISRFPVVLFGAVWREVYAAGQNWRNIPVALLLTLFAGGNLLHHLEGPFGPASRGYAIRLALGAAALLLALIGGRDHAEFHTQLVGKARRKTSAQPASITCDKIALASVVASGGPRRGTSNRTRLISGAACARACGDAAGRRGSRAGASFEHVAGAHRFHPARGLCRGSLLLSSLLGTSRSLRPGSFRKALRFTP